MKPKVIGVLTSGGDSQGMFNRISFPFNLAIN